MRLKYLLVIFLLFSVFGWYWHLQTLFKINLKTEVLETPNTASLIVNFLDVGQGDATLIKFPNNEKMLVDCSIDSRILSALGRVMSFSEKTIDYLVITHPDSDHYGGCIDVLNRYNIKNIVYNGLQKSTDPFWQEFWQKIQTSGAKYLEINKPEVWEISSSTIEWLYPDKELNQINSVLRKKDNNTSLIFKLNYASKSVLFVGDAENELEQYLLNNYQAKLTSNILKVGHHGSAGSSGILFLEAVSPEFAVISVGKDNTFGHPSLRVLKKLERLKSKIFRTDLNGDIECKIGREINCTANK
ncbi:MAG: Metallo-beta-lactamase domain protein [Candidatus Magasanikbacteria bacterium GW2011_GWC2_37_14]|uniref:Metallo-beta-lactamase domain protein n=1 Tax=Candidatus Magasanikbacteria bacterium GW2011_GWC2_37_14 TaxID=1619046 RepID=A0A0G0JJK2_9BACT|nr:MAG: Metallo-beta-lactamase domain protein [Candidatus Magasanikbacteria bacterium GW2011_GWC2_37_14]